ncbi:hypothetical protein SAMN04488565_0760 [Leucobacter chromiiresistens]|uniref:Uncharacterized protein n=1 Tax=Leucobacter chromiiresistens TaxID=1079994 RepID=A0A1H0YDV4_9MICO|nr:hypothetical protein SAMN04488565_0760 [Leucobacter chromiiresistens]
MCGTSRGGGDDVFAAPALVPGVGWANTGKRHELEAS